MGAEALGRLVPVGDRGRAMEQLRTAAGQLGLEELERRLDAADAIVVPSGPRRVGSGSC